MPKKSMRVKTRFEATEDVSRMLRKIEKNTKRTNKGIQRGFRKSTKAALGFKSVLKGILAAGAIQKGLNFVGRGLRDVSIEFVDFENTITEAALKFGDIGPRAENFAEKLREIEKAARKAGATTQFTAPQSAKALLLMAKGGFTSAEAMGALRGQIDFAIASGEDFTLSTKISTKLLGAFGLNVKNTEQKIKNLNLVNDTLTATVNNSSIGLEELFDAMKDIGPVARNLNTDIVDVAAMAGVLGKEGLDATKAMTGMRSLFLNLAAPSTKGAQILEALGLTLDSGGIKAKNMTEFLFELTKATKDFSQTERAGIFRGIFGKIGIAAATILSQGAEKVEDFKQKIKDSRGEVALMSKVMQTTLRGRLLELNSTLTELVFKVLDPFEKKIKSSITALTEFFRGQDVTPLVQGFKDITGFFKDTGLFDAALKSVRITFKILGNIFDNLKATMTAIKPIITFIVERLDPLLSQLETLATVGVAPGLEKALQERKALKISGRNIAQEQIIEFFRKARAQEKAIVKPQTREDVLDLFFGTKDRGGQPELGNRGESSLLEPAFQPQLNVDVQNNINAEGISVETEVKAPGTKGNQGVNNF